MDGRDVDDLAAARQHHVGRLLLRAHRDFNDRALRKLRALGHDRLTMAHTGLLPHLDLDGTRATTLAERAGMTKQAVGQLVLDLERHGYVERAPDPTDRRAALVRFTPRGWDYLRDAARVKREIEAEYAAVLGEDGLRGLMAVLTALLAVDPDPIAEGPADPPHRP